MKSHILFLLVNLESAFQTKKSLNEQGQHWRKSHITLCVQTSHEKSVQSKHDIDMDFGLELISAHIVYLWQQFQCLKFNFFNFYFDVPSDNLGFSSNKPNPDHWSDFINTIYCINYSSVWIYLIHWICQRFFFLPRYNENRRTSLFIYHKIFGLKLICTLNFCQSNKSTKKKKNQNY